MSSERVHPSDVYVRIARAGATIWNRWQRTGLTDDAALRLGIGSVLPFSEIEARDFAKRIGIENFPDFSQCPNFDGVDFTTLENSKIAFKDFLFLRNGYMPDSSDIPENALPLEPCVVFRMAKFSDEMNFEFARFGHSAYFDGAQFGKRVRFDNAQFGDDLVMKAALFDDGVQMNRIKTGSRPDFSGATFIGRGSFTDSVLGANAKFDGWDRDELEKFLQNRKGAIRERGVTGQFDNSRPNQFDTMDFSGAIFLGASSFRDRAIKGNFVLVNVGFRTVPDFSGGSGHGFLDLQGIKIRLGNEGRIARYWTTNSETETRLRRLRKIAKETEASDLERELFLMERQAQRGILFAAPWKQHGKAAKNILKYQLLMSLKYAVAMGVFVLISVGIFIYSTDFELSTKISVISTSLVVTIILFFIVDFAIEIYNSTYTNFSVRAHIFRPLGLTIWLFLYKTLSDCGQSLARPFFWMIIGIPLFQFLYSVVGVRYNSRLNFSESDLWAFNLGNMFSVFGTFSTSKKDLYIRIFPGENNFSDIPIEIEIISAVHSIVYAVLFFLMLLALRNRFRVSGGGS